MSPRIANWPRSSTCSTRSQPGAGGWAAPFVPGRGELVRRLLEVDHAALLDREPARPQLGVRHLLREGGGARDQHGGTGGERAERGHPQADEMRRWSEVRLLADAARGIETHDARA